MPFPSTKLNSLFKVGELSLAEARNVAKAVESNNALTDAQIQQRINDLEIEIYNLKVQMWYDYYMSQAHAVNYAQTLDPCTAC